MPPEIAKLLTDILSAGERIERFVAGKSYDDFLSDELQFEIIGEAMTRLIRRDPSIASKMADHRKIAGFRNVLIHGYDAIDDEISWGIITSKLPILLTKVRAMLKTG